VLNRESGGVAYNRYMRTHTAVAALLIAVATMSSAVFAEPARAQLHVQVVSERNASLAGATVTIYTLDGKPGVSAKADAQGVATFESVTPGLTQVVVSSERFASSIDKVTLRAGDNASTVTLHAASTESE
jgi:hypothetical protein